MSLVMHAKFEGNPIMCLRTFGFVWTKEYRAMNNHCIVLHVDILALCPFSLLFECVLIYKTTKA